MGRIGKVLSFILASRNGVKIRDAKLSQGGGVNITAEHFSPVGDDSHPLPDDYALSVPVEQTGREAVVGYFDPTQVAVTSKGEKRIYSRDADGNQVAQVWLKNDGSIFIDNDNCQVNLDSSGSITLDNQGGGIIELEAGGDINLNGVKITKTGVVTIPSSLTLAGKEIAGHKHSQGADSDGNTEQDTSPNL